VPWNAVLSSPTNTAFARQPETVFIEMSSPKFKLSSPVVAFSSGMGPARTKI
jgi:hypothetical protein